MRANGNETLARVGTPGPSLKPEPGKSRWFRPDAAALTPCTQPAAAAEPIFDLFGTYLIDTWRMTLLRRGFLWLYVLAASVIVVGVFVQAFSIAAYARGAGADALDLHTSVGFLVHSIEILVFLLALVAFWGTWRIVGFAALLPVVGTLQLALIGDTDERGSWVNGLHGLFALVVLMLALALVWIGVRSLARRAAPAPV